ncbi:Spermatogenesis-associated protein 5-like isoform X2 [Oopsacas minuta]|uniref:Spermatogenesis-associated protein 5-like isoform X2 n=1 Tax=Oopsacas minuta TaxID=111878 RepID=A0AAV7JZ31_9METZ|nr:Spermatogenesis-associated protein 5-like isoform X2 [Oopsacas minuta]
MVILLDDIDSISVGKDYVIGTNSIVSSICQLMDHIQREGGILVATCRRRDEVDKSLKRPGRLEKEIDLPTPNSNERFHILQSILKLTPNIISVPNLTELSWRAHGYVAGDLKMVVREATLGMLRRFGNDLDEAKLEFQDLQEGLKKVRPSAMRDVILEVPHVKWSDIGGMTDIIQKIRETVEWPLKHPEAFTRLGLRPPRGILLYGPPGCSKTMIARAIATESGLSFLAVKGPEIFSKWVGDSERAIRDIFSKARMVAPAIIFFDEIDALAVEREGQGSRVSDRVLTQLLTEMDGLERLEGVTVVAATNRPDLMDKALLRPGRMDRLIYIPIPDTVTREEIFRIKLSKMACEPDLILSGLIELSAGFSGAEIVNVCEEAAMICLQENIESKQIEQQHLEKAVKNLKPQITKEMKEFYEGFTKNTFFKK